MLNKDVVLYFFSFLFIIFLREEELILTSSLVAILFALCFIYREDKILILTLLGIGVTMPIIEMICIYFNMWKYNNNKYIDVPLWLFPLWSIAGFYIISLYNTTTFLSPHVLNYLKINIEKYLH